MLDPSQMFTRNPLDGLSIKQANAMTDFIADEVFTPVYCDKSEVDVYQYDTNHLREIETRASSKAKAMKIDYGMFKSSRVLELHKLAADIDPKDEANADAVVSDVMFDQSENIMSRLMIKRERLAYTALSTTGSYPAALVRTLAAGSTWADADGNPEKDVSDMREAVWAQCGTVPNALAIGFRGLNQLKQSPALKQRLHYSSDRLLTNQEIMNLLGVQYLHVCNARYDSSAKGATPVTAEIWGDLGLLYVKNPSPNRRQMRYGAKYLRKQLYTHTYVDDERGGPDGRIKVLEKGWEYLLAAGAVVSSSDSDFSAGALITNIY
jgi:hypothetical protein